VSVNATQGNVDVSNFQLLSNIGTSQLPVPVSQAAAVHKLALSAGVNHKAAVTSPLDIQVIYQASLFKSEISSPAFNGVYPKAVVTSKLSIPVIYQAQLVSSDVSVGIVGVFMKLS